jgi:hypothetical protein
MPAVIPDSLPKDFLSGPARAPVLHKIQFEKTPLKEYEGLYAVVIDGVMTAEECTQLLSAAEKESNWEAALVNIGGGRQKLMNDIRKCGRIMWDNQEILDRIWSRIAPMLPELQKINGWEAATINPKAAIEFTRLNERMRILKYGPGDYFKRNVTVASFIF